MLRERRSLFFVWAYVWERIVGRLPLLYSPDQREGLIFSATFPKGKNQSRRVYILVLGVSAAVFCFFFLKKE